MADLGVLDVLADGSRTAVEIAAGCGVDAVLLERLLRMLASRGALRRDADGRYANTGLSAALVSGETRDMVLGWAALPSIFAAWSGLAAGIRVGRPAFEIAHGGRPHSSLAPHSPPPAR